MCYCRHASETCKEQGVHAKMDLWLATIHVGKKQAYLGTYASKQEAGVVWDAASIWRSMKAPGKHVPDANRIALVLVTGIGGMQGCRLLLQNPTKQYIGASLQATPVTPAAHSITRSCACGRTPS